jgi:hypothetical protein
MARTDWRWVLAVGISITAFLLLYPNPVSPATMEGGAAVARAREIHFVTSTARHSV